MRDCECWATWDNGFRKVKGGIGTKQISHCQETYTGGKDVDDWLDRNVAPCTHRFLHGFSFMPRAPCVDKIQAGILDGLSAPLRNVTRDL